MLVLFLDLFPPDTKQIAIVHRTNVFVLFFFFLRTIFPFLFHVLFSLWPIKQYQRLPNKFIINFLSDWHMWFIQALNQSYSISLHDARGMIAVQIDVCWALTFAAFPTTFSHFSFDRSILLTLNACIIRHECDWMVK